MDNVKYLGINIVRYILVSLEKETNSYSNIELFADVLDFKLHF